MRARAGLGLDGRRYGRYLVAGDILRSDDPNAALVRSLGIQAYACHPLLANGRLIGTLSFGTRTRPRFAAHELELLRTVSDQVAAAVDRGQLIARLEEQVRERRQAEAERDMLLSREREARADAERASSEKDEFLARLSHELRTPLSAMLGWIRMLRTGRLSPDRAERALESIERNARVQVQLIEDLLDVTRIVAGKVVLQRRAVHLASVIEHAVQTLPPDADARAIRLERCVARAVRPVWGDFGRLQQVVNNLLSNAVKFSLPGGRVKVSLEPHGSMARITVADTGHGIDVDLLPHVFDRFRQGHRTTVHGHGGLGLTIVRELVELHGGTVHAESAGKDQGATFTVELPVMSLPSQAAYAAGPGRGGTPKSSRIPACSRASGSSSSTTIPTRSRSWKAPWKPAGPR